MAIFIPLIAVVALALVAVVGAELADLRFLFGVIIPGAAFALFVGIIYRVIGWARVPVPFGSPRHVGSRNRCRGSGRRSSTTRFTLLGCWAGWRWKFSFSVRFSGTPRRSCPGNKKVVYTPEQVLWAVRWHFTGLLLVILRHFRFFTEPFPNLWMLLQNVDGFMQVGLPVFYASSVLLLVGWATCFFVGWRRPRCGSSRFRRIISPFSCSWGSDPGFLMRHLFKVDLRSKRSLRAGFLQPVTPDPGVGAWFYVHIFLVSVLLAYFPFSKLMHMAGVFMSPTRNLANNNRARHHVNPWDSRQRPHLRGVGRGVQGQDRCGRLSPGQGVRHGGENTTGAASGRARAAEGDWRDPSVDFEALRGNWNYPGAPRT